MIEIDLTTPAILFSTISLLLLAYTNRFLGLAKIIRELHRDYQANPQQRFVDQINNLRRRVILIRDMQFLGVVSLLLCTVSMVMVFGQWTGLASLTFVISLLLMAASLTLSLMEIRMSIGALNVHLTDMEQALSSKVETDTERKECRRWMTFSMPSLLWLSLVVALAIVWHRDRTRLKKYEMSPRSGTSASWSIDQLLGKPNANQGTDSTRPRPRRQSPAPRRTT